MTHLDRFCRAGRPALLVLVSLGTSGCTSVLSTGSLRDLVWDGGEPHAVEAAEPASDSSRPEPDLADADAVSSEPEAVDTERREAAIDEAVERLAKLGSIGEAARATLVQTLERTEPEDWPTVIEAFAESLPPPETHVAAKADLDATAATPPVAASPEPEPMAALSTPSSSTPSSPVSSGVEVAPIVAAATAPADEPGAESPPAPEPAAEEAPGEAEPLLIQNACFATRVQGWGVVDRFAVDLFRPGQEVIVYFELAGLSAGESPAGHTTCIDSTLRLVAADGTVLHTWSFEPIAETCRARRHDYFARYVVRLPEAVAGACRIELGVSDTLSGKTASAVLPLEVRQPLAAR
jgi:hypothetical protein